MSLDALFLPLAATEEYQGGYGQCGLRAGNRGKDASRPPTERERQNVGQRNLKHPVTAQINQRRRACVAGAVEGLHHHHSPCVTDVADSEDMQTFDSYAVELGLQGEESSQPIGAG